MRRYLVFIDADECTTYINMQQVPQNLTVDEAASIGLTLDTAALGLYSGPSGERSGAGLTPPWTEGGHGKYAGQPCVIFGGASGVGQYGKYTIPRALR